MAPSAMAKGDRNRILNLESHASESASKASKSGDVGGSYSMGYWRALKLDHLVRYTAGVFWAGYGLNDDEVLTASIIALIVAENPSLLPIFEDIRQVNNLHAGEPITSVNFRTWLHHTVGGLPYGEASEELQSISGNPSLKDELFKLSCPPPPPSPASGRRNLHLPPAPAPM